MRKQPTNKDIRTFEEILEDGLSTYVLHRDRETTSAKATAIDRLKLLRAYAAIADSAASETKLKEFEKASLWYSSNGYPASLGKDHMNDDITRPIEVVLPILQSSKSLKGLIEVYEHWKNQRARALLRLMIEETEQTETVADKIQTINNPLEQLVAQNRRRKSIINDLLRQKLREKKYGRTISKTKIHDSPARLYAGIKNVSGKRVRFRGAEFAYYSDYAVFNPEPLEPFLLQKETDEQIIACAEDQLLKAANTMLRGIQPTVTHQTGKGLVYEYSLKNDWHVIAKAFAELLTDQKLSLVQRECEVCKKDISSLIKSARQCHECRSKKRKLEK